MKREHITSQTYIDWLKSLGCVFYAPLDAENGLNELIQGWTPNINQNMTCVWDANEQAYLLTGNSSSYAALMYNGKSLGNSAKIGGSAAFVNYTIIGDFKEVTRYDTYDTMFGNGGADNYFVNISTGTTRNVLFFACREMALRNNKTCQLNAWYNMSQTRNGGQMVYTYFQNQQIETASSASWGQTYYQTMDEHVSLGCKSVCYVKNLYIFNKVLTNDERTIIFNHDH